VPATGEAPAAEQPSSGVIGESASALPLSALDVLLIVAGVLCLLAAALLIRRLTHIPK